MSALSPLQPEPAQLSSPFADSDSDTEPTTTTTGPHAITQNKHSPEADPDSDSDSFVYTGRDSEFLASAPDERRPPPRSRPAAALELKKYSEQLAEFVDLEDEVEDRKGAVDELARPVSGFPHMHSRESEAGSRGGSVQALVLRTDADIFYRIYRLPHR